ncbi:MAG: carboxypeptidase regulatory-like domain-containing protein [Pedobacter sp.]|nr:MAG: carboxypeptidase regulatory-like domain-containing protein [Pedobacter sp.]
MLALLAGLFAFTSSRSGGIRGKIVPADGADRVVAVSGKDTLTAQISRGHLTFNNVKADTYQILIKGRAPYKDTSIENVAVIDSTTTDIGDIKLVQ